MQFSFLTLQTLKNLKRNHHLISPTVLGSPDQHDSCSSRSKTNQQRPEITTELPSAIYQSMAKINCLENTASLIVFFLFLRLGLVICCLFSPLMCTNNLFFFVFFVCLFRCSNLGAVEGSNSFVALPTLDLMKISHSGSPKSPLENVY